MNRILVLLVLVSFALSSVASAESIDLSSLSLENLVTLQQQIYEELSSRTGVSQNNVIGRGSYVVGKDIKPGYYDFVCLDTGYFNSGTPDNDIYIYLLDGDTAADLGEQIFWEQRFAIGSHVTFNLEEGTLLIIEGCSGFLKAIQPEWLP